jgi:hypothetical protein
VVRVVRLNVSLGLKNMITIGCEVIKMTSLVISIVSLIIAILSAIFAALRWKASKQAAQIASHNMYRDTNDWIFKNSNLLGPLTPYGKENDKEKIIIRQLLLLHLNRFKYSTIRKEQAEHINFRRMIMGNSLSDFKNIIKKQGANDKLANKIINIFVSIKEKESYFDSDYWKKYFEGYNWTSLKG